jgi:hypothetical protein
MQTLLHAAILIRSTDCSPFCDELSHVIGAKRKRGSLQNIKRPILTLD